MAYDLQPARAPRTAGFLLRLVAFLIETPILKRLLTGRILRDAGIASFRQIVLEEAPSIGPALPHPGVAFETVPAIDPGQLLADVPPTKGFAFETAADFVQAYRGKKTTPDEIADRIVANLRAADNADPPLRAVIAWSEEEIRRQATASTRRYRQGEQRGPLDGVPIAIKDELDLVPYATTVGTRFLKNVPRVDSTVAERLRAAGAILIGKTNMHEIGIDTSGYNLHHGTARNPYDPMRYTGGSSSGSGAAVAAGLCPIAIGADGGGSIRIPASLCGVVGLKATWGRISEAGAAPLCWSVAHVGPLAATVRDAAVAYAAIAGSDSRDPNSMQQPPVRLDLPTNLAGRKIAVYEPWLDDAEPGVVESCRVLLNDLRTRGAQIVDVDIPDLELGRVAHAVTILSEMATGVEQYDEEHRRDYAPGVRLNLALARELTNRDYVRAQQARTRLKDHFDRIFRVADVLLTPTTGITAPFIRPDAVACGESDLSMTSAMMRFVFPMNLTGHPALSLPAGYDQSGMPVGVQITGRPWEEHVLLGVGAAIEQLVERRQPRVHYRLLE